MPARILCDNNPCPWGAPPGARTRAPSRPVPVGQKNSRCPLCCRMFAMLVPAVAGVDNRPTYGTGACLCSTCTLQVLRGQLQAPPSSVLWGPDVSVVQDP